MKVDLVQQVAKTTATYLVYTGALIALVYGFLPQFAIAFNIIRIFYTGILILGSAVFIITNYSYIALCKEIERAVEFSDIIKPDMKMFDGYFSFKDTVSKYILPLRLFFTLVIVSLSYQGGYILLMIMEIVFFITLFISKVVVETTTNQIENSRRILLKMELSK